MALPGTFPTSSTPLLRGNTPISRFRSLDLHRGLTIFCMIVANSSGPDAFTFLQHAKWTGWTFADTIFPSFLFIVGAVIPFSMKSGQWWRVVRRTLILFCLGIGLNFLFYSRSAALRIPGILQRISVCYFVIAAFHLSQPRPTYRQHTIVLTILILTYVLMTYLLPSSCSTRESPFYPIECTAESRLDLLIFGKKHLYDSNYDPEGSLSTFTAIAATYAGYITGLLLSSMSVFTDTLYSIITHFLLTATTILLPLGYIISFIFPISKSLYTPSFLLLTTATSLIALSWSLFIADVRRMNSLPVHVLITYGRNAILLYVLHSFVLFGIWHLTGGDLYKEGKASPWLNLIFALGHASIYAPLAVWLEKKGWFLRV